MKAPTRLAAVLTPVRAARADCTWPSVSWASSWAATPIRRRRLPVSTRPDVTMNREPPDDAALITGHIHCPPSARDGPSVGKVVDRQLVPARLAVEPVILPSPPPFGELERFVYVGKLDRFRGRGRDPHITPRRRGRIWPGAHLAPNVGGSCRHSSVCAPCAR